METSFAQKYWKDFELLALEYIHEQYKDLSAKCIHTSFINDGGYDGCLSLELTNKESPFVHEIISLIEAKLRTTTNVNIHDFAASIIAAYNFSANILYVVSNKNFTPETHNITKTFSQKVNLQIVLVDGSLLLEWLTAKSSLFVENEFYHKLIESIKDNVDDVYITREVPCQSETVKNILCFSSEEIINEKPEKIYGTDTIEVKNNIITLLKNLSSNNRVAILYGPIGTGKSTIISNISYELQQDNFLFSVLDGECDEAKSIRTVYLWVLKSLWGIDPTELYSVDNVSDFVELICSSSGVHISTSIVNTLKDIFNCSHDSMIGKSDLYTAYLMRYLDHILSKRRGKNRSVLALKNLHHLDAQVLDFLIPLIKCLVKNKVGVIVELDSIESQNVFSKSWEMYYNALKHFGQGEHLYELKDLLKDEALAYLKEKLPGLSIKYYEYIISHIGQRPIFLKYAVDWLCLNKIIIGNEQKSYYTVAKPDEFFNGITPNQNLRIIEDIIRYYQSPHPCYHDCFIKLFEAAILMDGFLNFELIEAICKPYNCIEITQLLINTSLFRWEQDSILISHQLILKALKNVSLSFYKQIAAEILYKYIDDQIDTEFLNCKKVDLLEVLGKWELFYPKARNLGNYYISDGQYHKALCYLSKCQKYYSYLERPNHFEFIDLLYNELFAYHKIGLGVRQKELFEIYQSHLQVERKLSKKQLNYMFVLMEKMYQARLSDSKEQYASSQEMMKYAKEHFEQIPEDLYVECCFVFALIEKKFNTLEKAIDFLKCQKDLYPYSIKLDIEYQSHSAARYLNTEPEKALPFYKNIINYSGISKHHNKSIGHAYVDLLTCYLLLEDWERFEELYPEVLEYVQTNTQYTEEGRLYNLDGLYYWLNHNLELSERSFRDSQFYLGLVHNSKIDVLVKVNFIGLLIARCKKNEAVVECNVACQLLPKTYKIHFQQIGQTKNYRNHREYAALLALAKYCGQLGHSDSISELISNTPIVDMKKHINLMLQDTYPEDVFADTCILHSNIIILTK